MCLDHCDDGHHHHHHEHHQPHRHLVDWRRAWGTSRVEPIPLEPVDSLTITCVMDSLLDALAIDEGPARRPARTQKREPCGLMRRHTALDPLRAEAGFSMLISVERAGRTHHILFDCGLSTEGMVENMRRLDIEPRDIGAVVFSHGHWDHITGLDGLSRYLRRPQNLPIVLHPEAFTRRRMAVPGRDPFDLPVLSRRAVRDAGFDIIEQRTPSFLLDGSVLITGEVDRTTDFERGMPPYHQAFRRNGWEADPLVIDDQALILNVRDKGLVVLTVAGTLASSISHAMQCASPVPSVCMQSSGAFTCQDPRTLRWCPASSRSSRTSSQTCSSRVTASVSARHSRLRKVYRMRSSPMPSGRGTSSAHRHERLLFLVLAVTSV